MIPGPQGALLVGGDLIHAVLDGSKHVSGRTGVPTLTNGNLTYTHPNSVGASAVATIGKTSGKRYFEAKFDARGSLGYFPQSGLALDDGTMFAWVGAAATETYTYTNDGGGNVIDGVAAATNSIWGIFLDFGALTFAVKLNNTLVRSRSIVSPSNLSPFITREAASDTNVPIITFNFGQNAWAYDPGAGWAGWNKEG